MFYEQNLIDKFDWDYLIIVTKAERAWRFGSE